MDLKNIPKKYRPIPFWSWNEKLDVVETAEQIHKMDDVGIGGFFMHARSGLSIEYLGEKWFSCIESCLKKARELHMNAWVYDENGWPSGFGNGKVNGKGEKFQQKYLRIEKIVENLSRRTMFLLKILEYWRIWESVIRKRLRTRKSSSLAARSRR